MRCDCPDGGEQAFHGVLLDLRLLAPGQNALFQPAYLCLMRFRLAGVISPAGDVPTYPRASSVADPFPSK